MARLLLIVAALGFTSAFNVRVTHRGLAEAAAASIVQMRPLQAFVGRAAKMVGGGAALLQPHAVLAIESGENGLPDDSLVVGFAVLLLVATGLLNLSLGDIAADEAQLPSSVNLINKNRARRSNFIKGKDRDF